MQDMIIAWVPVEAVRPFERNPKLHPEKQIKNIAESIRRYGWRSPLLVKLKTGELVAGHGRLLAAKRLGLETVPVLDASDLSEAQLAEYRYLDNKLAESPWDMRITMEDAKGMDFGAFDLNWDIPAAAAPAYEPPQAEAPQRGENPPETARDGDGGGHFWGDAEGEETDEYREFTEKFVPKKTSDDCYTPDNIYAAVRDWAVERYGLQDAEILRPFYPGGDYQAEAYPAGCAVIDNPPFSILSEICRWYQERGIRFFLFAPGLTLFSIASGEMNYLPTGTNLEYENGADILTSFVTNLGEYKIEISPELYAALEEANRVNLIAKHKDLPKYSYPDAVITGAVYTLAKYGQHLRISAQAAAFIRCLDAQKEQDKAIFGGGFLLSEKAAAEKAAAEKAAAEKAAAEKAAATKWALSDRELAIQKGLG